MRDVRAEIDDVVARPLEDIRSHSQSEGMLLSFEAGKEHAAPGTWPRH